MGITRFFVDAIKQVLPRYREREEEGLRKGDLYQTKVDYSDLKKTYEQSGIARKLVDKKCRDMFDKWFTIQSDNQKLIDDAEELFSSKQAWQKDDKTHLGLKKLFFEFKKEACVFGWALLALGIDDDAELEEEIVNPKKIEYATIHNPMNVKKIYVEVDETSENYGEIIAADIKVGAGYQRVHASRFILNSENTIGSDPRGIGSIKPSYRYLTNLENTIWSVSQAFYRYGTGFPVIKKKKMTSNERTELKSQWRDVNARTGWICGEDVDIDFKGVGGVALRPKEYFDVAMTSVAMSFDIPVQIAMGVAAGAVTGSETNLKDYYSDTVSKVELEFVPIVERIIRVAQATGQIAEGDFRLVVNPLFEETPKEKAEVEKIKAETIKLQIESGVIDKEKVRKEIEQKKYSFTDAVKELVFAYDSRTKLQAVDVEKLSESYSQKLQKLFSLSQLVNAVEASKVAESLQITLHKTQGDSATFTDDFNELEKELELVAKEKERKIKETVDEHIDETWNHGQGVVKETIGEAIISSERADLIKKIIKQSNFSFVNSIGKDITKKVLFEVQQGILQGEGINLIKKRLVGVVEGAKRDAERIARTETARTMSESIKQSYKSTGIIKNVEWVTALDEAVCPQCGPLDGKKFALDEVPPQPLHPNCRCTLVAAGE